MKRFGLTPRSKRISSFMEKQRHGLRQNQCYPIGVTLNTKQIGSERWRIDMDLDELEKFRARLIDEVEDDRK